MVDKTFSRIQLSSTRLPHWNSGPDHMKWFDSVRGGDAIDDGLQQEVAATTGKQNIKINYSKLLLISDLSIYSCQNELYSLSLSSISISLVCLSFFLSISTPHVFLFY